MLTDKLTSSLQLGDTPQISVSVCALYDTLSLSLSQILYVIIYEHSNLRGVSYGIQPMERLQVKRIAGRILPAIATTTAAVSALSCIELIKIVQMNSASNQKLNKTKEEENLKYVKRFQKDQRVKKLHNSFLNLAVPLFSISEPVHAQEFSLGISEDSHENNNKRNTFTIWDVFDVNPKKEKLPLAELVRRIEVSVVHSSSSIFL